jgi:cytochrome P450
MSHSVAGPTSASASTRLEMRTALARLLDRLPDIELSDDADFSGLITGQLTNIIRMPARFTPEA